MARLIDADALMKNFCGIDLTKCVKYGNADERQRNMSYSTMMMYEIADAIEDAQTVDTIPVRHGIWMDYYGNRIGDTHRGERYCSACGEYLCGSVEYYPKSNYCPNCGVKMENGG